MVKIDLTKKELKMLIGWCRVFEAQDDTEECLRQAEEYWRLADKLKRSE